MSSSSIDFLFYYSYLFSSVLSGISCLQAVEAFAALLAVAAQGIFNDGIGLGCGLNLVYLYRFAFQLLVVLKEAAQHEQAVGRHFGRFAISVELRILGGNGDDLVIFLASIDHGHEADGAGVDDGERGYGLLTEDEDIDGIVVFGKGLRDEAVVGGIVDGGVEDAVELDEAAGLIELVLNAGAERDFDDAVELLRKLAAGSYVVPGVDHECLPCDRVCALHRIVNAADGVRAGRPSGTAVVIPEAWLRWRVCRISLDRTDECVRPYATRGRRAPWVGQPAAIFLFFDLLESLI